MPKPGGEFAGSVAVVRQDDTTAQIRWLVVEPKTRGRGIGRQLITEAVRFARDKGFKTLMLWIIDFLHSARTVMPPPASPWLKPKPAGSGEKI